MLQKLNLSMYLNQRSDIFGAMASGLCLIHCMATPLLFIAQTCSSTCCDSSPFWWKSIDFLFIAISFIAIYQSSKTTSKHWVKVAFWANWSAMLLVILNENIALVQLPELSIYALATSLILLHIYNKKFCQCKAKKCCIGS
ncbi:MerC domain-containing protein [Aureibacter tunicatorum]|uniref:MerC mercury resistance protein n=1 Tax=Aureibacter tunicatorum TaxID=866807 RepID=A0AAE4BRP8_9BACT|nr:MerC domain-containing protein [Aureibacter tunicatorum]MDR6240429.1 hypothetical protein [Aureibacter tunicatorum]BDD05692.1 hypothetical protein AUTU_31750 [Aureibacter tunicatorum]